MNSILEECMYKAGLTAQGCWDQLDEYNRTAIIKFAELIVTECANVVTKDIDYHANRCSDKILNHFGVSID